MGRLRIRTSPVQLGSAKAGTELGNITVTDQFASFKTGPRNLPLKFCKNPVSNS